MKILVCEDDPVVLKTMEIALSLEGDDIQLANNGEKALLIDAHTSELERGIQLIENHVEYLRASSKNCESYQYVLKNVIELMNYLK